MAAGDQGLMRRILASRETWLEVEPGKEVCIRRPDEAGMQAFAKGGTVDEYIATVVDWRGFTEADVLGESIGGDAVVAFDALVVRAVLRDHVLWVDQIAQKVRDLITQHLQRREDTAKN